MKVVFLDIDGVLKSRRTVVAFKRYGSLGRVRPGDVDFYLDPIAVKMIEALCENTEAKVVISSSWRIGATVEELQGIFTHYNVNVPVIDRTPYFTTPNTCRGDEINHWLNEHPEVTNYVIIDDDSDMLESQKGHFVQTDHADGFKFENFEEAVFILNERFK